MPTENTNLSTTAPAEPAVTAIIPRDELPVVGPADELEHLADELGLDPTRYLSRTELSAAIDERRRLIAGFDRGAMIELLTWGRRAIPAEASNEQLAREIGAIRSMRFTGLSQAALLILGYMRRAQVGESDDARGLVRKLKLQESLLEVFRRKKRSFIGKIVANLVGENRAPAPKAASQSRPDSGGPQASIKHEIEESGFFGGITNRIKRTADQYLNQKLDEIETRIDRKLDEIDHRLSEWRDKEIANRLKILKITLWASVIVALVSLIYSWVKANYMTP